MGNENQGSTETLEERYKAKGFFPPQEYEYENELEKQIFMAINLIRSEPNAFEPYIKAIYSADPRLKKAKH